MNALNDLTAEVKFRERMRGYDYDEVDEYVKTVKRLAALAQDQIAELQQRVAQLESRTGNDDGAEEVRETLLRTLVLAQRTADAAVSEARSEAQSITGSAKDRAARTVAEAEAAADERLRSSEERASRLMTESEESSQLIIAEAKRTASAELAAERARATEEIDALEATKADLETNVAAIETRLAEDRNTIRDLAASLQSFVSKFEPVDAETPDAPSEATQDVADDAGTPDAGTVEEADETGTDEADGPAEAAAEDSPDGSAPSEDDSDAPAPSPLAFLPNPDDDAPEEADSLMATRASRAAEAGTVPDLPVVGWDGEANDESPSDAVAPEPEHQPEPAQQPATVAAVTGQSEAVTGGNGSGSRSADRQPVASGSEATAAHPVTGSHPVTASHHAPTMPFAVDSPELFDIDAEEDDEFIEQLRQVVSSDAPLPDTDAAMAAFFNHDADLGPRGRAPGRGR